MPHLEEERTSDRKYYLSLNTGRTDHRTFDRLASLAVLAFARCAIGTRTEMLYRGLRKGSERPRYPCIQSSTS